MGFRKEVRERLTKLEEKMQQLIDFYGNTKDLQEQNERLFDKLMSRNWEEYRETPTIEGREKAPRPAEIPISPLYDESNIGEILSDEEIGK